MTCSTRLAHTGVTKFSIGYKKQDGSPSIQQDLNIKDIIDNAKAVYASSRHQGELNSVARYHVLQPE